jgi:hypothetical protein
MVPVCILAAVGLAVCLMHERRVCLNLDAQNDDLRRQLSKMAEINAKNQRLSNLLAEANARRPDPNGTTGTNVATEERLKELARLRSEVEALHQKNREIESLRADTRATSNALQEAHQARRAGRMASRNNPGAANGAPLEILEADYGSDRTNMDVSAELSDRIRGGSLKIIASNQMAGDPDFGHVKSLTVVYRFGGAIQTNQFREGDFVILPPEAP